MRKLLGIVFSAVLLLICSTQVTWAQKVKFYDLGHYPNGTWAEPRDIDISGVVVGFGDVPPNGYTHPIGVPVFGPDALQWFDLGTLGGDRTDTEVMCMAIADTGMIVGHSAIAGNEIIHAFAWTPQSGMVDIGTLADLGPRYSGYNYSLAVGTNKTGTLIVGWSSTEWDGPESLPVVWTPQIVWTSGRPMTTWKIHKLDMGNLSSATGWSAGFANNSGQIIGTATSAGGVGIAVLWNPLPGGERWRLTQLPVPADYPGAEANDINNNGEIVGDVISPDGSTSFSALWEPTGPWGRIYNVTVLPTLAGSMQGAGDGEGINDVGDIVGGSLDADGNYFATRWNTKDLNSARLLLRVPGGWSWATKVNNNRVATGSYGNNSVPENTVAWQFH
jgi:probable HAF family extracellular repeat protein